MSIVDNKVDTDRYGIQFGTHWSDDNPYYALMPYAKTADELRRLRDQAMQWEANLVDYDRQMSDQRALRDEDRLYNSPAAQIQRERAAGRNPDLYALPGGSGSGSSGAHTPPQFQSPDLEESENPLERAQRISTNIGSVFNCVGILSSLGQALNIGTDFLKGVMTFDDALSQSESTAKILQEQARGAKSVADLDAISAARGNLEFAGNIAQSLSPSDGSTVISDDAIVEAISNAGFDDEDGKMANLVRRFTTSPGMQKNYNDLIVERRQSEARKLNATFEFFNNMESNQVQLAQMLGELDIIDAQFSLFIDRIFKTAENAKQVAANDNASLDLEAQGLVYKSDQLNLDQDILKQSRAEFKQYLRGYCEQLGYARAEIKKIDDLIQQVDTDISLPPDIRNARLVALRVKKSRLESIGCNTLASVYDIAKRCARDEYMAPYFYEVDGLGMTQIKDAPINLQHNGFMDLLFSDFMNNGMTIDALLGNVVNAGAQILTGGLAGTITMRGQNMNNQNQRVMQQIIQRGQNMRYHGAGIVNYYNQIY